MSYTFSRRAFLKYSAATAVAVAGASLLGGCEYQDPNNPVSKALPSAITSELQVIGGLRGLKIENGTCTIGITLKSQKTGKQKYYLTISAEDKTEADYIKKRIQKDPEAFRQYLESYFEPKTEE